jgi:uncharacterized membrane protein required for colicin V production
MSIEKNIEKVVDQNVEQITRDFKSFIPDNIVEIAIGYSISFVFALLIFFIGKWISKSVVKILGKALRKVGGVDETLVKFLENIVYYALLTVVIIAALNKLGIATTSFLAILPATGDKFQKAKEIGVNLQDVLDKKVTLTAEQAAFFVKEQLPTAYKTFAGFEIHNLFEFFIVFVILCGIAAVILASISPILKKMMHGIK